MTGAVDHEDIDVVADGVVINTNLLDKLRKKNEFSIDRYGSLDEILDKIEDALREEMTIIIGENLEFSLSEITLFSTVEDLEQKIGMLNCAVVADHNEQLLCCIAMGAHSFHGILEMLLGNGEVQEIAQDKSPLTDAETKLYLRICDQIAISVLNTLEIDFGSRPHPHLIEQKFLNAIPGKMELISVNFGLTIGNVSYPFAVLVPLEILEPGNIRGSNNSSGPSKKMLEWKNKLNRKLCDIELPLHAQIASAAVPLADIVSYRPGIQLDMQLDLKHVKISDSDGNCAFLADIELSQKNIQLRVVKTLENTGD